MTNTMTPPPEFDLPPGREAQIRGAVLRSTADPRRRTHRPRLRLVVPLAVAPLVVALAAVAVLGVRLDRTSTTIAAPSPSPAVTTSALPAGSVETDTGPLNEADARAAVDAVRRPPDDKPAALAEIVVARRISTALGEGTFVVWTTVDGTTWYEAEIPGEMGSSGPITGPAATKPPRLPDSDHPVTRLSDLAMFGWTMDADRPDATARNLHAEHLYLTTSSADRVEVRMTVEGKPGPWFSAPVHDGYAFVPTVTMGAHSTTEDVDNVTTIEDRALDHDGHQLPIRAR